MTICHLCGYLLTRIEKGRFDNSKNQQRHLGPSLYTLNGVTLYITQSGEKIKRTNNTACVSTLRWFQLILS